MGRDVVRCWSDRLSQAAAIWRRCRGDARGGAPRDGYTEIALGRQGGREIVPYEHAGEGRAARGEPETMCGLRFSEGLSGRFGWPGLVKSGLFDLTCRSSELSRRYLHKPNPDPRSRHTSRTPGSNRSDAAVVPEFTYAERKLSTVRRRGHHGTARPLTSNCGVDHS